MRLAARCMAAMAVALVLVPEVYGADTAKPKANAKKDASAAAVVAPAVAATGRPDTAKPTPVRYSSSLRAGASPGDASENYTPKVEWFAGYSFWRAMPTAASNRMGYLHGGSTSIAYNLNRYVGLVADFGGYGNSRLTLFSPTGSSTVDANGSAYTYVFGPRFSYRGYERFTPFVQALFGGTHATSVTISGCTISPSCTPLGSESVFASMLGTGFDIKVSEHIALRLFEGDFLLTHFKNPLSVGGQETGWQKNVRFSTGIVFRLGGHPAAPPRAPLGATCSADPEMVYAGSGDFVAVRAQASNPDNNPLTYSWSASEGAVDGTGPEARWNSTDRRPGTYSIRAHVGDGRRGTANCSVNIRVEARPNRPPTMSCSADHGTVKVGEAVVITAIASDPDNDPLSFSWTASGGKIEGTGPSIKFQSADLPPGPYIITGRVDDGRGGAADCTVDVAVQAAAAAQPSTEVRELESKLALHSIYFATARPTAANPIGGLVESQQEVLVALANDFNHYLSFKPQAHLILEGHADRRGSVAYNKDLTERRVARTKSFLTEHRVPAANIETRALGKQENLDAEQVKELVEKNPDLSAEERQKIERNLPVIVLANNRRVDVTLESTGQPSEQSVRQYPFNAKDSLALLSTKGGEKEKTPRRPRTKKPTSN